mmetsp:Transcript_36243/g.85987  ORF Transcript_36243/g.85987 Transcript_36243/m.85987 type:complete len:263 (-) Transcript_36243:2079-2867(-)
MCGGQAHTIMLAATVASCRNPRDAWTHAVLGLLVLRGHRVVTPVGMNAALSQACDGQLATDCSLGSCSHGRRGPSIWSQRFRYAAGHDLSLHHHRAWELQHAELRGGPGNVHWLHRDEAKARFPCFAGLRCRRKAEAVHARLVEYLDQCVHELPTETLPPVFGGCRNQRKLRKALPKNTHKGGSRGLACDPKQKAVHAVVVPFTEGPAPNHDGEEVGVAPHIDDGVKRRLQDASDHFQVAGQHLHPLAVEHLPLERTVVVTR